MRPKGATIGKSTLSRAASKPAKPYPSFPCYSHSSGRWAAKVAGKTRFFGRWGNKQGSRIVPVDDVLASAEAAKAEYDRQVFHLLKDQAPPPAAAIGATMRDLCNDFLDAKKLALDTKKLAARSFKKYKRATDQLMEFFGGNMPLELVTSADFTRFYRSLNVGQNPYSLSNDIRNIKIVLKWAYDAEMVDKPFRYGPEFKAPPASDLRRSEQDHQKKHGKRLFDAAGLRLILESLAGRGAKPFRKIPKNTAMRAMVLLGVNAGLGQSDCSSLEEAHLDLKKGWLDFPRVKTAVERRIPLWPETVDAIRAALTVRGKARRDEDRGCVFITTDGQRWVHLTKAGSVSDTLGQRFAVVLKRLGLKRDRLNFYALRHVTETIGGRCRDQVAVDLIMGHAPKAGDMGAKYREEFDDARLLGVTDVIRDWLFPKEVQA